MGCCFSKATTQYQTQNPDEHNVLKNQQPHLRPSPPKSNPTHEAAPPPPPLPPPPPPLEEESVKEVLSETPISKLHQVPILTAETKTQMPFVQNPDEDFETKDPNPINKVEDVSELVSPLSEACSMSESFSTATTTTTTTATITERREEDEATSKGSNREGTTHKWNRSPSYASSRKRPYTVDGNVTGVRERRPKSSGKRLEPSPEKKIQGGSRPVRGRESGPVANRKVNAGVGRDSGEGSGRRSRSPASARTIGGASKVGAGSARKQVPPVKGVVEKEEKGGSGEVGEKNDVVSQEESTENPHVSMECFIFL